VMLAAFVTILVGSVLATRPSRPAQTAAPATAKVAAGSSVAAGANVATADGPTP